MDWLNGYLRAMATVIERHGGIIDDYAGDGFRANFGFPVKRTRPDEIAADYEREIEAFIREMRDRCRARRVDYNFMTTETPYHESIEKYLLRRGSL